MAKSSANNLQTDVPAKLSVTDKGDGGSSPKLRGLDSNPQGAFGPRFWQAFRDSVAHIYDAVAAGPVGGSTLHPLHPHLSDAPRDPDALSGHGVHHDAGARTGRARRRPAAHLSPDRRLGGHRLRRAARASSRPGDVAIMRLCAAVPQCGDRLREFDRSPCARERARGTAGARAARPCLSARERRGASDRRSDAGVLCAGRRSDGERSRGGDRGHRGADDRLRARKAGGR